MDCGNTEEESDNNRKINHCKENVSPADNSGKQDVRRKGFCKKSPFEDWREFEQVLAKDFTTQGHKKQISRFLEEISKIATKYVAEQTDSRSKVVDFHLPHQLMAAIGNSFELDENPRDLEQLLSDCRETLKYSVRTGHPHYVSRLSTGLDIVGLAGEWITAAANSNMGTYDVAPVFTLMEKMVLQRMLDMVYFTEGEGIFAPGGSISNLYAILCARHNACPEIKTKGMQHGEQFVIFTSKRCHYSIKKAAIILGIGLQNVVEIETDNRGRMLTDALEAAIVETLNDGKRPLMVNATSGTTVLGAYDVINDVADICENHGVWLHVDAAYGGGVLFSKNHRHLMDGIERADSLTWNPHKMMCAPLQCSAILLRKKGILEEVNQIGAEYIFQKDKVYDTSFDTGDKAIQCGRRNDVFKLWLMWRSKGDSGFGEQIDKNFRVARYLLEKLKQRPDFQLVQEEFDGPNVCFWYFPEQLKRLKDPVERNRKLHLLAPKLMGQLIENGTVIIQFQTLGDLPNFFRIVITNPLIAEEDINFIVDEIDRAGREISQTL